VAGEAPRRADLTPDGLKAIAWGAGRRIAAGQLEDGPGSRALWEAAEDVAGVTLADLDRAIGEGIARGFDPGRCSPTSTARAIR
jgi:hypothetical protein